MEYSDGENESDTEVIDDLLKPEDLFNDEANEASDKEQNETEEPQDKQEDFKDEVEKKIKQPRLKKNLRPTLNYNTLKGDNGLGALKELFKDFKFKGSGHEKEDLARIMGVLQQWMSYRLCPSYNFESCMLHLEALGKKRINQVLMKKYRLGMDEWGKSKTDEENNIADNNIETSENLNKNKFDLLLDEEIANIRSEDELIENEGMQTLIENQQNSQIDSEVTLTPEQLERIARNRKLAEERRLKRMSERHVVMEMNQECEKTGHQELPSEKVYLHENH